MDDELLQLEAELKSLQPLVPSRRVEARIARELAPATPARRPASVFWFWAAALPAAAALAIGVGALMRRDLARPAQLGPQLAVDGAPTATRLKPIAAENLLYAATDEGLVVLDDGTRARRERRNYVDTITWKDPRTNASLKWTVPREEIRFVPVNFQ